MRQRRGDRACARERTPTEGRELLAATTTELAGLGFTQAVLHVLVENDAAVRLYESAGSMPVGPAREHSLLKRPSQTYRLDLG